MRLDHIAYRVADRRETADFFIIAFGYRIQDEFDINFDGGEIAKCIALEPLTKGKPASTTLFDFHSAQTYHTPPEIFVSDGTADSVVGKWVAGRGGVGGIHHLAYELYATTNFGDAVADIMRRWSSQGLAEFTTKEPLKCEGLVQVFTKPHPLTGVIYEFIEREGKGFCRENVKELMKSTEGI